MVSAKDEPEYQPMEGTQMTKRERRGILGMFRKKKGRSPAAEENKKAVTEEPGEEGRDEDGKEEVKDYRSGDDTDSELDRLISSRQGGTESRGEDEKKEEVTEARDGWPVITSNDADKFRPSQVRETPNEGMVLEERTVVTTRTYGTGLSGKSFRTGSKKTTPSRKTNRSGRKELILLPDAPSARDAAFGGPPLYDWIDIETAAAVKVQSIYRRNKVYRMLEEQNLTTAAMRNRMRARKASRRKRGGGQASEDVPSALRFCGVGFLFGDATGEDDDYLDAQAKAEREAERQAKEKEESRRRQFRLRKKASERILESVEVVEDMNEWEEKNKNKSRSSRKKSGKSRNKSGSRRRVGAEEVAEEKVEEGANVDSEVEKENEGGGANYAQLQF